MMYNIRSGTIRWQMPDSLSDGNSNWTGPAVRHITSASCWDTARLETSEGQTMLNMGLHGRERPLPLNFGIFTTLRKVENRARRSSIRRRSS